MLVCTLWTIMLQILICSAAENDFLDIYNSTLAVVVERKFMTESKVDLDTVVKEFVMDAKKTFLKSGELSVEFYSRTDVSLRKDLRAVLSIASCANTWRMFRNAEDESILHLAITEADCPRLPFHEAITIPLVKGGGELSQIILDLKTTHLLKWETVVVLYDESIDRDEIQKILSSLALAIPVQSVLPTSISVFKLPGISTEWGRRKQLKTLLDGFQTDILGANFLVISTEELVGVVMEIAKSAGLVHPLSQWLYVITDTDSSKDNVTGFSLLLSEGENVAFIYNVTSEDSSCKGGVVCNMQEIITAFATSLEQLVREEIELANQVSEEEWEAIKPSKLDRRTTLLGRMKLHMTETGKCDNCISWNIRSGETWGKEYQVENYVPTIDDLLDVGSWQPKDGPVLRDVLFPHIEHGFRGRKIPLVSFHYPPWQIVTYNESGQIMDFKGLIFEIVNELSLNLNFSYSVMIPSSQRTSNNKTIISNSTDSSAQYGNATQDPSTLAIDWNSIIEIVQQKKVLLAAGAFIVNAERKRIINFTIPVGVETYTLLVARPQELTRALLFLSPFTFDTWLSIAIAIVIIGPLLNWFHCHSPYYDYFRSRTPGGLQTKMNCWWYVYGALLQQGGIHLPMADSGRLIIGTWWLFVLVIVTTYSGNLVAFLTFPKIDIPITSVEELLVRQGQVTWGVLSGTSLETHLKNSMDQKYKTLYDNAEIHLHQSADMIDRVRRGEHVYIDWKTNLLFLMKREFIETGRCDFTLGTEEFLEEQIAMIVAQGSPYLPRINAELKRIHQVGLIHKWMVDYLPKKDKCWSSAAITEIQNHTVNMRDMQGSFFVLFFGFILSTILVLVEYLYNKRKVAKEKFIIKPFVS